MSADFSDRAIVIVGGGLTGMAISYSLSKAGIRHVLVGEAPNSLPRLGESLNLEGTLLLDEFCGEYARFFGPKTQGIAYMGDYVVSCSFDVARRRASRTCFRLLGQTAPSQFLHIDRLGLDAATWERTVASPFCTVADAKVEAVAYDTDSDSVRSIALSNGAVLDTRYVFDASNHKRVVADAIGVPVRLLGEPQRAVYTHYRPSPGAAPGPRPLVDLSTNLLRLFKPVDGLDAMAWYIPLPSYISIGVTHESDGADLSDDEALERVEAAYARRGLRYRERYPEPTTVMNLPHRYFAHERAHGANWLLAGGTYASVWWLAGAGVGTSLVAGRMAAAIVAEPRRQGLAYETYLKDLLPIHDTFDWFVHTPLEGVTEEALRRQSDRFVRTNVSRLAHASQMNGGPVATVAGQALAALVRAELTPRRYCDVVQEALPRQTERTFGFDAQTPAEEVVLRLADVIAGRAPLAWSDRLLADGVVCHLDRFTGRGRRAWRAWVRFIRSRRRTRDLGLAQVGTAVNGNGDVVLSARWTAGGRTSSDDASATYRVVDGRITEVWSTAANYTFVLGWWGRSRSRMACVLAWVVVSGRLRR